MATLAELHAALFPDAVPVAPPARDREPSEVAWIRVVRARVPALDVLDPGDVVVVPAAALPVVAPGEEPLRELVATFAGTGVAGLLLVPQGGAGDAALDELAALATAAGIPAYRLGRADPGALERSVIGYLVDRRGELERQAAVLEERLAGLALMGRGLDELVAAIGQFLSRGVALEGRVGDALAVTAPAGVEGSAAAVAAYLADPSAVALRVPLPVAPGEAPPDPAVRGSLALLGERPIAELDRVVAARIAPLLALELVRDAQVRQARDEARRSEPLPSDGPPWVVIVARQATGDDGGAVSAREETRRDLRFHFPARRLSLRGTSESLELRLVAAAGRDDPAGMAVAARVAALIGRPVAVSRPFSEPGRRPAEEAAARAALEAAELLAVVPTVARADRMGAYRLSGNLRNLPDGLGQARALLDPLLVGRPAVVRERLATLRAVLDHGGAGEAAAALGVHRNTVAYRLRRIEALTGWDLADPELRLALGVAVRILGPVQSAQTEPRES